MAGDVRSPESWVKVSDPVSLLWCGVGGLVGFGVGFGLLVWPGAPLPVAAGLVVAALAGVYWLGHDPKLVVVGAKRREPVEDRAPVSSVDLPVEEPTPEPPRSLVELVDIPAGTFRMGSPGSDDLASHHERPRHRVTVSAFRMAKTPITRETYRRYAKTARSHDLPAGSAEDRKPANGVTWYDAIAFCNDLSRAEGLTECYAENAKQSGVKWDVEADGYRLPTEAEWEYACRAGSAGPWVCGDQPDRLEEYAWTRSLGPVGVKLPNAWGLHDMAGSVWEWCWDWYGAYSLDPQLNPLGPAKGSHRLLRGGSWLYSPRALRSAYRNRDSPTNGLVNRGFRVVRGPLRQH